MACLVIALDILENQRLDLGVDIVRLVAHRHAGDACWKKSVIGMCQAQLPADTLCESR